MSDQTSEPETVEFFRPILEVTEHGDSKRLFVAPGLSAITAGTFNNLPAIFIRDLCVFEGEGKDEVVSTDRSFTPNQETFSDPAFYIGSEKSTVLVVSEPASIKHLIDVFADALNAFAAKNFDHKGPYGELTIMNILKARIDAGYKHVDDAEVEADGE